MAFTKREKCNRELEQNIIFTIFGIFFERSKLNLEISFFLNTEPEYNTCRKCHSYGYNNFRQGDFRSQTWKKCLFVTWNAGWIKHSYYLNWNNFSMNEPYNVKFCIYVICCLFLLKILKIYMKEIWYVFSSNFKVYIVKKKWRNALYADIWSSISQESVYL